MCVCVCVCVSISKCFAIGSDLKIILQFQKNSEKHVKRISVSMYTFYPDQKNKVEHNAANGSA